MLTLKWIWKCDLCNAREEEPRDYVYYPGGCLETFPPIPAHWSWVGGKLVCNKHTVLLCDEGDHLSYDGETVTVVKKKQNA